MSAPVSPAQVSRRKLLGAAGVLTAAALVAVPRSAFAVPTSATTVTASSFGFDPVDSTAALQAALDSAADVVVIDNVGADWITRPLFLRRSNVTVVVEEGVTVRAKVGGFPNLLDSLLTVDAQTNVTIIGYGATFAMNKPEYTTGEWRMTLLLRSVSDTVIEGLTLRDSGGDGVYLGVSSTNSLRYNQRVVLRNLVCDNHRRNALSVISADDLLIEGCAFTNADGTAPRSGVDFEPNHPSERISNVVMRDCALIGNWSCQLVFALMKLNSTSAPTSILVQRCLMDDQPGGSPVVMYNGSGDADPGGTVEIRDCLVKTVTGSGSLGVYRKSSAGTQLTLTRTVFWNWGNQFLVNRPIIISADKSTITNPIVNYGGVTFNDCAIITDQDPPLIRALEPATGSRLSEIHGTLTMFGPQNAVLDYGSAPQNVDLAVTSVLVPGPANAFGASVSVSPEQMTVVAGEPIELVFSRNGGLLSAPLAIQFTVDGTAIERKDYYGVGGTVVIPPHQSTVTLLIPTRTSASTGSVRTTIVQTPFYTTTTSAARTIVLRRR